jgi:hypothetical protein
MKIPLFEELASADSVLLIGAGGGFDVFCGLPLYYSLCAAGKSVHLANLSFSELSVCEGDRPVDSLVRVTPASRGSEHYFPELHLSSWLSKRYGETPVYAIERTGALRVRVAYEWLVQTLRPDALILIDGGMDSLLRGDERDLGTPHEDMASLHAARAVAVARKYLVCLGFGIDSFHGVCHAHCLENMAALIESGGYLGAWSLLRESEEYRFYAEACDEVAARMPNEPSIVQSSILAAAQGLFGDRHPTQRTVGSTLFLNPLMSLYWAFRLDEVVRRNLYLDRIAETRNYRELSQAIDSFRATLPLRRPWQGIPC